MHCIAVVVLPTPVFYSTGLMVVDVCAKNGGAMGLVCGNLHKTCHELMVYHTVLCFCLRTVLLIYTSCAVCAMNDSKWLRQTDESKISFHPVTATLNLPTNSQIVFPWVFPIILIVYVLPRIVVLCSLISLFDGAGRPFLSYNFSSGTCD